MNDSIKINLEKILYLLAILLALAVRLIGLGSLPLSDPEANLALQSLDISRGQGFSVQGDPAYVLLTGGLFSLTQPIEFAARWWPAILGAALPLAAYWLRERIGKRPALILAFGLALDPGLVAISRQASGAGMAVAFALLAGTLALKRDSLLAGIFVGLALLSGVSLWPGLLAIGLIGLIFGKRFLLDYAETKFLDWKSVLAGILASLVVVGTLLMTVPFGLGGIGSSLGTYINGWGGMQADGQATTWTQMLLSLLAYHLLPLIFCLVGVIRSISDLGDSLGRVLAAWFGLALLLAVVYPSRQVPDLVWCLIPMWLLAARELARIRLGWKEQDRTEIGYAVLVMIMIIFLSWSLVGLPGPATFVTDAERLNSVLPVLAGLALFLVTFGLVLWGWGLALAASGLRLGLAGILPFVLISSMWNAAGLAGSPETEMWRTGALPKEALLMQNTLDDYSTWNHHSPHQLDVAVVALESDSLRWMLRDYREVRYLGAISAEDTSSVLITSSLVTLSQVASYRGQDFIWLSNPAWELLSPYDFTRWAMFRQVPMQDQRIILWIRSDLFPGAEKK